MILVAYYALFLFVAVMAWPCTYGLKSWVRLLWLYLGCTLLLLPLVVGTKAAFYYGLLGNATIWSWAADTFMGKNDRRARTLWSPYRVPKGHVESSIRSTLNAIR
jgi:hypothetical protein